MKPESITFLFDARNEGNELGMAASYFSKESLNLNGDPAYCYNDYHLPIEYVLKKYYPEIQIKYKNHTELKKGERALYRVTTRYFVDFLAREGANVLESVPKEIRDNSKVLLLFNDVQEYACYRDVTKESWKPFVHRVSKEGLNGRIMLVSGNKRNQGLGITIGKTNVPMLDYFLKDTFGPIYGYRYFEEVVSFQQKAHYPTYSYDERQKLLESDDIRLFVHLNRVLKDFRAVSVYKLWKNDLLENGFVSHSQITEGEMEGLANSRFVEFGEPSFQLFLQNLPLVLDTPEFNINHWNNIPFHFVNKSFLWLVSETLFDEDAYLNGGFMTEKTYKPISLFMPFIILGNPLVLQRLKNDGYETFSKWWDESYDEETEPTKRMNKIIEVLNTLKNLSKKEMRLMYTDMKNVLQHNAYTLSNTQEAKPFVQTLMKKYHSL